MLAHYVCIGKQVSEMEGRSPVLNTAGQLTDRRNKEVSETDTIFWLVIPTPASKPPLIYKTISL